MAQGYPKTSLSSELLSEPPEASYPSFPQERPWWWVRDSHAVVTAALEGSNKVQITQIGGGRGADGGVVFGVSVPSPHSCACMANDLEILLGSPVVPVALLSAVVLLSRWIDGALYGFRGDATAPAPRLNPRTESFPGGEMGWFWNKVVPTPFHILSFCFELQVFD